MTRLAVSVEGQTEEEFVKQVLAEHLRERRVRIDTDCAGSGPWRVYWRVYWRKCVFGSTRFGNGGPVLLLRRCDFVGRLLRIS